MACTFAQHTQAMKDIMGPAYLGEGLPSAMSPQHFAHFNTGYPVFGQAMWTGYTNGGCSFWASKIAHWQNQLNNNTYNPYQTQLKQTKIAYAQHMWVLCGCTGPPPVAPSGGQYKLAALNEEEKLEIDKLVDEIGIEYDKFDN